MHGDSLLMLTTKVVSNKEPPLLSDSESGGSTSQGLGMTKFLILFLLCLYYIEEKIFIWVSRVHNTCHFGKNDVYYEKIFVFILCSFKGDVLFC